MPGISVKRLDQVQKTLEAVFADEPDTLDTVTKGLEGLRAAIAKGDTVTADDLSDILGEVVVEKAVSTAANPVTLGDDPLSPIFLDLYKSVFEPDGTIKKGLKAETAQETFQKAYEAALGELDGAIEGAVEATAAEIGKARKKPIDPEDTKDGGVDEDCEDMTKLLKSMGVSPAMVGKIAKMQTTIDELQAKDNLQTFTKMAEDAGQGAEFAKTLLALHNADPKLVEPIVKRLKTAAELLKKSDGWSREIGGAASPEGGTSLEQLNAHARDIVSKGEPDAKGKKMTFAKAFTAVCERHPELYTEYQREQRAR